MGKSVLVQYLKHINLPSPQAPLLGDMECVPTTHWLFCTKFNSEQLLFEQLFHIIGNFGSDQSRERQNQKFLLSFNGLQVTIRVKIIIFENTFLEKIIILFYYVLYKSYSRSFVEEKWEFNFVLLIALFCFNSFIM